ncbi:MAG: gas vesicle protein GvpO [Ignavibacteria bacterium]|jgi:hypothetical protein|nr:gas vesicle protein GvpO [Ignavibacteria bacterium]
MDVSEAIRRTEEGIPAVIRLKLSGVIGAMKKDDGWHVSVEMVERHALPDSQDLLGVYEVVIDEMGKLMNYERKRVRRRNEVEESAAYD